MNETHCSTSVPKRRCDFKNYSAKMIRKNMPSWILSTITVLLFGAMLQNHAVVNMFARAVLKLTIMQFVDLDNFKNLLHDSCLIYKEIPKREPIESDCYTCESIDRVDVVHDPENTLDSYAELNWPAEYESQVRTNVSVNDIARVLLTGDYIPCEYGSNLKIDPLRTIEIKSGWFMHWRNCDDIRGKMMRSLYRPDSFLSISFETWTVMSLKYKTIHYKKININYDGRVAIAQICGTFYYQLLPKTPCTHTCKSLSGRLKIHHILIFNSYIWNFQYLPINSSTESIAVIYYLE